MDNVIYFDFRKKQRDEFCRQFEHEINLLNINLYELAGIPYFGSKQFYDLTEKKDWD